MNPFLRSSAKNFYPEKFSNTFKFSEQHYKSRQLLTSPDCIGDTVYYLLSGEVEEYYMLEESNSIIMFNRKPGKWLGCSALYGDSTYKSYSITVKPTSVYEFNIDQILTIINKKPSLKAFFDNMELDSNLCLIQRIRSLKN